MSPRERGVLAGYARAASLTPEQRKTASRKAYLAGAVNAVVNRAPELSDEQVARLRAVLCPVTQ